MLSLLTVELHTLEMYGLWKSHLRLLLFLNVKWVKEAKSSISPAVPLPLLLKAVQTQNKEELRAQFSVTSVGRMTSPGLQNKKHLLKKMKSTDQGQGTGNPPP